MSTLTRSTDELSLSKFVLKSLIFHAIVVAVFVVKVFISPPEDLLIQRAVRVDLVALPDKAMPAIDLATPEPEKAEPVEQKLDKKDLPKVNPKAPDDTISLEKNKKKQADALKKLKQMSALDKLNQLEDKNKKPPKGPALQKGNALTGIDKLNEENYLNTIDSHIKDHLEVPQYLKKRSLTNKVLLKVDKDGNVIDIGLLKSSGNPVFDDLVVLAIKKSSPVPSAPDKLAEYFQEKGLVIEFTSD